MKRNITKAEYELLTPEMKLLYVANGDNFKLHLIDDADNDPGELRRARDREKEEARVAKELAATLKAENDALKAGDGSRKTGDIATLEASWKAKLEEQKTADAAIIATLKTNADNTLRNGSAMTIAKSMTKDEKDAALLLPHILPRLSIVQEGDVSTVKVTDATGRISALNFDELKAEFVANPSFATVVVGSRASGAGGSGGSTGGAGGAGGAGKSFAEMTGVERTELFKSDPTYFNQLAAADKTAQQAKRFSR